MDDQQTSKAASSAASQSLGDVGQRFAWFFKEHQRLTTETRDIASEMSNLSVAIDAYLQTESHYDTSETDTALKALAPLTERVDRLDVREEEWKKSLENLVDHFPGMENSLCALQETAPEEADEISRAWGSATEALQAEGTRLDQAKDQLIQKRQESSRFFDSHAAALRQRMPGGGTEGAPAL